MLVVVMKCLLLAEDLSAYLKRQLIFLVNSVAAYDNECVEEAARVGAVIRVLCTTLNTASHYFRKSGKRPLWGW